ncbi:MAG: hypothetical protein KF700_08185 [Hyphomonadaceae bacterium]|nr:hypothetical protein [Hyphomonadaceae bacterium]
MVAMLARPLSAQLTPFVIALAVGVAAMAAPLLALLALGTLGAAALVRCGAARFDPLALAGPAFATLLVGGFLGWAYAVGVLFLWRVFADARWSTQQAARLAEAEGRPREASWPALAHAWLTPAYGVALVAFTAPHMVAGMPLDLPHVPVWAPVAAGALAAGAVFDWALRRAADWRLGELAAAPALHLVTHHALFLLSFGLTLDVSAGICAMAAWRLAHAAALRARQTSFTAVP